MTSVDMAALKRTSLGEHSCSYDEFDAILYALAVGAHATELDQVFERDLVVLPTYGLTLGLWAADRLGSDGIFDTSLAVHSAQTFELLRPLPRRGTIVMNAEVAEVWDRGSAAVIDVLVRSEYFRSVYTIHAPGSGGFGGEPVPTRAPAEEAGAEFSITAKTHPDQAALYRLTGDRHFIHIDPVAAHQIGSDRPILHGLCTLAVCVRAVASHLGTSPTTLTSVDARFSGMVLPGDELDIRVREAVEGELAFTASVDGRPVLRGGRVGFGRLSA